MDNKSLFICLLEVLLFHFISARPGHGVAKRATDEKNINDVFSRFTKGSKGWASYYGIYPIGTGACSLDPMPTVYTQKNWIKVAAGEPDFQSGLGCGTCLKIEASGKPVAKGNKALKGTYYAVIVDLCGACGQGDLDFYMKEVFDGKWEITFDAVDCPDVSGPKGNIQYRFSGSNPWYLKLQITNSKLPTAAVEFFIDGKWQCATRASDNHFLMNGGEMKFPMRTRLTSIAGETVGGDIPKLENGKDQDAGFQYKNFKSVAGSSPPKLPCHGQGGLKRPGKADETDNQGQEAGGGGSSSEKEKGGEEKPGDGSKDGGDDGGSKGGKQKEGEGGGSDGSEKDGSKGAEGGGPKGNKGINDAKPGGGGEASEEFCKDKEDGIYANPDDCSSFYQCANKKSYKKKCPPGLHFNAKIKNCDYPKNAGCSKGGNSNMDEKQDGKKKISETKANTTSSKDTENVVVVNWCQDNSLLDGRHANPKDCSKFINCSEGKIESYRCPNGYQYGRRTKNCEKSEFVDCQDRPILEKTTIDSNSSLDNAHDQKNALVSPQHTSIKDSDTFMISSPDINLNALNSSPAAESESGKSPSLSSPETSQSLSPNPSDEATKNASVSSINDNLNKSDTQFCQGKPDGYYPAKSHCNAFYKCAKDFTQMKSCPTGLKFNPEELVCDWPRHVKCEG